MEYVPKFIAIVVGSLFIAIGVNFFLVPFQVLDGGMIGISLILNYLWDTKIGLMIILLSVPVFVISYVFQREYFYEGISGMLISAFIIDLFAPYQYHFLYYIELTSFTSAVVGGALVGTGIGFMLRYKTSTGGTDLLAQFLVRWVPLNVGLLIFIIDGVIVGVGGLLFSLETFYNSMLTISAGGVTASLLTYRGKG